MNSISNGALFEQRRLMREELERNRRELFQTLFSLGFRMEATRIIGDEVERFMERQKRSAEGK